MNDGLIIAAVVSTIAGIFFGLWSERFRIFQNHVDKKRMLAPSQQKSVQLFGLSDNYFVQHKKDSKRDYETVKEKIDNQNDAKIFKKSSDELREDLKVFQFEKKITAKSLQDIFDARKQGKIDVFEFDRLVGKYKKDLIFYNEKISRIAAELDFSELFALREEIDEKIGNLKIKYNLQNLSDEKKTNIQKMLDSNAELKENAVLDDNKDNRSGKQMEDSDVIFKKELMIEKYKEDVTKAIERLDKVKIDTQTKTNNPKTLGNSAKISEPVDTENKIITSHQIITGDNKLSQQNDINDKKKRENNFASPLSFIYRPKQGQETNSDGLQNNVDSTAELNDPMDENINNLDKEKSKKIIDSSPLNRIVKH